MFKDLGIFITNMKETKLGEPFTYPNTCSLMHLHHLVCPDTCMPTLQCLNFTLFEMARGSAGKACQE